MNDPTEFHPVFTPDRLRKLAAVLVRARREALELHDPDAGEGSLSLGTRTFERACEAFRRLKRDVDWLDVYEQGYYFLLLLQGVPMKFHRTDPEYPAVRTTRELEPESSFKQEAFAFMSELARPQVADSQGFIWRLYFEDDPETREVLRVALVRVDEAGKTDRTWDIDVTPTVATLVGLGGDLPQPTELDEPEVGPISTPGRRADDVE